MTALRVTVVGQPGSLGLEGSYGRALTRLGCDVSYFDLQAALARKTRLSHVGRIFNTFVPVEAWARKANRELLIHAIEQRPDLILVAGSTPVRVGTLAQIKVSQPRTKLAMLWPDPLVFLARHMLECLPVFDLVGTYSRDSVPMFERLGARRSHWLPFAVDFEIHPSDVVVTPRDHERFDCEVVFVGNHRPERELAALALLDAGVCLKVFGTDLWRRDAAYPSRVDHYWQKETLMGADFVKASRCAKLCLNLIDPGNYPAANMRFFENFGTGTASVNSTCPELADRFRNREETVYFATHDELVCAVRELLADEASRQRMGARAREVVRDHHTYVHRATELLAVLELGSS